MTTHGVRRCSQREDGFIPDVVLQRQHIRPVKPLWHGNLTYKLKSAIHAVRTTRQT